MGYLIALVVAIGFGVPIAVIGAGLGQGRAVASAMEAMARQPEAAPKLQLAMIIGLAFIESLVIYALAIALFMLFAGVPSANELLKTVIK